MYILYNPFYILRILSYKMPPLLHLLYYEEFYKLKYCSTVVYMVPRA